MRLCECVRLFFLVYLLFSHLQVFSFRMLVLFHAKLVEQTNNEDDEQLQSSSSISAQKEDRI